jgi:hypothetical protein
LTIRLFAAHIDQLAHSNSVMAGLVGNPVSDGETI